MKILDIGDLSKSTGVPVSTLRYYDEIGLIASVGRHGLRRLFAPEALLQLKLIAMGQWAGFSLGEIARMFRPSGVPDVPRAELQKKADGLNRQIKELTALRDTLRHVAECRAPSHLQCPKFRRLVDVAGRRRAKGKKAERRPKRRIAA